MISRVNNGVTLGLTTGGCLPLYLLILPPRTAYSLDNGACAVMLPQYDENMNKMHVIRVTPLAMIVQMKCNFDDFVDLTVNSICFSQFCHMKSIHFQRNLSSISC